MRTFPLNLDDNVDQDARSETENELEWLGDMTPELTVAKSKRFVAQTIVSLVILAGFLFLI